MSVYSRPLKDIQSQEGNDDRVQSEMYKKNKVGLYISNVTKGQFLVDFMRRNVLNDTEHRALSLHFLFFFIQTVKQKHHTKVEILPQKLELIKIRITRLCITGNESVQPLSRQWRTPPLSAAMSLSRNLSTTKSRTRTSRLLH